jgi:hypothetical protein
MRSSTGQPRYRAFVWSNKNSTLESAEAVYQELLQINNRKFVIHSFKNKDSLIPGIPGSHSSG